MNPCKSLEICKVKGPILFLFSDLALIASETYPAISQQLRTDNKNSCYIILL